MRNKKIAKSVLLAGLVLVCVLAFNPKVLAITASELQQQINALLAQLASLQQQLAEIQGNQGVAWCHTFNANLRIGDKNKEVISLHQALEKEGYGPFERGGDDISVFDEFSEQTASATVEFQEKYANEILKPYGLKRGTGFVGKTTRAKLNKLYGCAVACTADVKQCPDGSYVSRTGANCEFSECPTGDCVKEGKAIQGTDNWSVCCSGLAKIYDEYAYKYPNYSSVVDCSLMPTPRNLICTYCGNGVCGTGENKCNCPSDCTETALTAACADTDNGFNYYIKGTMTEEGKTYDDVCAATTASPNTLWERACSGSVFYDCPNGCYDGACQRLSLKQPDAQGSSYSIIKWMADLETGSKVNLDLINQTCLNNLAAGADKEQCIKAIAHGLNPGLKIYYWTDVVPFISGLFSASDEYRVRIQEIKSTGAFGVQDQSEKTFKVWL